MNRHFAVLIAGLSLLLLAAAPPQQRDRAEVALRAAIEKETVDGDLKAAIEQYKKIAAQPGVSRNVAATALLHLGQCYEKLGQADARKTYERLLRDFGDQAEIVKQARERLSAMGMPPASTRGTTALRQLHLKIGEVALWNISAVAWPGPPTMLPATPQ